MKKPLAMIAVALGLVAAAPIGSALAQPVSVQIAGPEFGISIGVPAPRIFVPAPVIVAPPVVVAPAPRVIAPAPVYYPAYYPSPYYHRPRYVSYPHRPHRYWDARLGRWCD